MSTAFFAGERIKASYLNSGWIQQAPSTVLSSASNLVTISGLSTINNLLITWYTRTNSANSNDNLLLQFNLDTGNHYGAELVDGTGTTVAASSNAVNSASGILVGTATGGAGTAGYFSCGTIFVPGFGQAASGQQLDVIANWFAAWGTGASSMFAGTAGGAYNPTGAINSFSLNPANGQLVAKTVVSVYGSN
jgi:hypothetical protein